MGECTYSRQRQWEWYTLCLLILQCTWFICSYKLWHAHMDSHFRCFFSRHPSSWVVFLWHKVLSILGTTMHVILWVLVLCSCNFSIILSLYFVWHVWHYLSSRRAWFAQVCTTFGDGQMEELTGIGSYC